MPDTIFDRIIRKEIPADIVYEDEDILAFNDINAQAPVHVLVIPKRKFISFTELHDADPDAVSRYIQGIAKVARQVAGEHGYRIVFNTGEYGQQTVDYIHAHILSGRRMSWPPG